MTARRAAALACMLAASCAALRLRGADPLVSAAPPPLDDDLDLPSLREAVDRTQPAWVRAGDAATPAAAAQLVAVLATVPDGGARRSVVARAFRVLRVREPVLLTAYYEPELAVRLTPDRTFRHPLYARPPELVDVEPGRLDAACECRTLAGRLDGARLAPYPSRAEIDAGALAGRSLELAWAADPIALFILQVQGSGRLRLDDGRLLGVRYAGSNGRPYRSVAHALAARGLLTPAPATLPDVRRALAALPADEQAAVLATDERYVFFRLAEGGPVGSLGAELTPGRSIAADPRLVPPGTIAYLSTRSVRRFVVTQDTGAAITGPHADLFLGAGTEAEARAGVMRERGTLYLLLPRP